MKQIVFRVLGGILGLLAAIAAVIVPLLFISNSLNEAESVRQNGGHFSLSGVIGGSVAVLALAGLFGFLAFTLLRYALRRPKSHNFA
jgi:small-conductance mechanosensitive channel